MYFVKLLNADKNVCKELIEKEHKESQQIGAVSWSTYLLYFTGGGKFLGVLGATLVLLLFVASQAMMIITDYWLAYWYYKVYF